MIRESPVLQEVVDDVFQGGWLRDFSRLLVTTAWEGMDDAARAADPEHGCTFILDVASRGRSEPDVKLGES